MQQNNIFCSYVVSGVVRRGDCTPHYTRNHRYTLYVMLPHHHITTYEYSYFNSVILARNTWTPWWWSMLIETCRSAFKCFSGWHFKLIFYYVDVHLLAHFIQWIKNARWNSEIQKNQFKISFIVTAVLFVAFLYTKNHFGVKFVSFFVVLSQFLLKNTCLAFSNRLCNSS
jgi:hypothetical protein